MRKASPAVRGVERSCRDRLGDRWSTLERMAQRLDVEDLAWVVRRSGSSSGRRQVADLLLHWRVHARPRGDRREVKVLTAEGRLSAYVREGCRLLFSSSKRRAQSHEPMPHPRSLSPHGRHIGRHRVEVITLVKIDINGGIHHLGLAWRPSAPSRCQRAPPPGRDAERCWPTWKRQPLLDESAHGCRAAAPAGLRPLAGHGRPCRRLLPAGAEQLRNRLLVAGVSAKIGPESSSSSRRGWAGVGLASAGKCRATTVRFIRIVVMLSAMGSSPRSPGSPQAGRAEGDKA